MADDITQEKTQNIEVSEEQKQIIELKKQIEYYKTKNAGWEAEAKELISQRDEMKLKLREGSALKNQDEDTQRYIKKISDERDEAKKQLLDLQISYETAQKLDVLKGAALKHGMKENYFSKIDKFIDISKIDISNDVSLDIALSECKNTYPDIFIVKDEKASSKNINPVLSNSAVGQTNLEEEYRKEMSKEIIDNAKANELYNKLEAAGKTPGIIYKPYKK